MVAIGPAHPLQRQRQADRLRQSLLEDPGQPRAFLGIAQVGFVRIDVDRQALLARDVVSGILVAGDEVGGIDLQPPRQGFTEALGLGEH